MESFSKYFEKPFSKRPDILVELVGQIFRNKQNYAFKMKELKLCLERGIYSSFRSRYFFKEKNWYRSIGNAIKTLQEIGYEIIHNDRSYAYISKQNKSIYELIKAIKGKQLIKFDYKRKLLLEKSDYEKMQILIKGKPHEEVGQIMYDYQNERDIVVSPYDIIGWQLLCGKKTGKDSEKTYDFFVYDIDRMQNIRIEKTSNNTRYYSYEKAIQKLKKNFYIDSALQKGGEGTQIIKKNIPLYKTYEICNYEKNLIEELGEKFANVVAINRKNARKYYTKFIHFDEDDVFYYIQQINTEDRNIRFKKREQQIRFEDWLNKATSKTEDD